MRPMRGGGLLSLMISNGIERLSWEVSQADGVEKLEIVTKKTLLEPELFGQRLIRELSCQRQAEISIVEGGSRK